MMTPPAVASETNTHPRRSQPRYGAAPEIECQRCEGRVPIKQAPTKRTPAGGWGSVGRKIPEGVCSGNPCMPIQAFRRLSRGIQFRNASADVPRHGERGPTGGPRGRVRGQGRDIIKGGAAVAAVATGIPSPRGSRGSGGMGLPAGAATGGLY
jgi:hypothetical protein